MITSFSRLKTRQLEMEKKRNRNESQEKYVKTLKSVPDLIKKRIELRELLVAQSFGTRKSSLFIHFNNV